MRRFSIGFLFLSVIVLVSCKKEIVEIPESNDPLFQVSGTIGNDSIHYIAGDNDATFSNYASDINGVTFFAGKFTQGDSEIELGLFKGGNDLQDLALNDILQKSAFNFAAQPSGALFEISREDFQNQANIKAIKWYVDGEYSGMSSLKIYDPGQYSICAQITYENKYTTEICNDILVGYERNADFSLEFSINPENRLNSWISVNNTTVSEIKWYLNNQLVSQDEYLSMVLSNTLHQLKAEITFANGSKRTRTVVVDGTQSACSIEDFGKREQLGNLSWDYKLKMSIQDQENSYSSLNVDNEESSLQVTSITYYGLDKKGNPVYIVSGILNSKVKSKTTNEILDVRLNISWGLGLK